MQLPGQLQQTENEAARAAVTSECSYQSTYHNSCSRALECTKGYRKVWGDLHVSFDSTHHRDVWVLRERVNTRDIRRTSFASQKSGCVVCQLSARQVASWEGLVVGSLCPPFSLFLVANPTVIGGVRGGTTGLSPKRERLHGLDCDGDLGSRGRADRDFCHRAAPHYRFGGSIGRRHCRIPHTNANQEQWEPFRANFFLEAPKLEFEGFYTYS